MNETKYVVVENVKLPLSASDDMFIERAESILKKASCFGRVTSSSIYKKSVDARRKNDIKIVCSVIFEV